MRRSYSIELPVIAYLNLRYMDDARARMFRAGLQACGYEVAHALTHSPAPADIMITWNRIGAADQAANAFQSAGCQVLATENASWGNSFAGESWFHIARNYHNTAGCFPIGNADRWDGLGIALQPWRSEGETVILAQRGIGARGTAAPHDWHHGIPGRIRQHPGMRTDGPTLEADLARAGRVITWGSGGAIKALIMGIPVQSHMPNWIGEQNNTDEGRLAMMRRLAWAQWRHSEIESGEAFRRLLVAPAA